MMTLIGLFFLAACLACIVMMFVGSYNEGAVLFLMAIMFGLAAAYFFGKP